MTTDLDRKYSRIERAVTARMDALDHALIKEHTLTQAEYDARVRELDRWVEAEFAKLDAEAAS